ncbi:sulfite oxidase [Paenibacillus allorhizosphaerae]|uniref:Protein-methionine-sulfoxide reductase catalytic subunit MsrP n=1 Tax=Paenibacillus allorhizosphaerae TaxID=2849866 RepID=A0ABN7TLD3_9BACL|nr:sulfite oxidase [Paenibacillus allorhizosphaerae]CAG7635836.1 Protein-methionine-sulfoxide reductase catalytic subunit MsrP [Paenibacillus allorhizosphaerae]
MLSLSSRITPDHLFYIRNHFPYPGVDVRTWELQIEGLVDRPIYLRYQDLNRMHQVSIPVTLECAGDKRAFFHPKVRGEQWESGASSHAIWTGVRLVDVLSFAGVQMNAMEVTFEGMDKGTRTDMPGEFAYIRSLPIKEALHPNILIALYMNGKPLPDQHGFPARLIVPGWYGMASVKWLHRIKVIDQPFHGPFQTIDYVYERNHSLAPFTEPVTTIRLNSTMARPTDQEVLAKGEHWLVGTAISGTYPVVLVEISTDHGVTWQPASWLDPHEPYSWRRWCLKWTVTKSGTYEIRVRAVDAAGYAQPETADWNKKGYGYNAVQKIQVYVD